MDVLSIVVGFLATLIATLVGVGTAFWLNRQADKLQKRERVLGHLRALEKEFEINREVAEGNRQIGYDFSHNRVKHRDELTHYVMELLSTDAWDAAVEEQLIGSIEGDLYNDLLELYSMIKRTNELIHRLRIESLQVDPSERTSWTINVAYYDYENGELDLYGFGILLMYRCRDINLRIGEIETRLVEQIEILDDVLNGETNSPSDWIIKKYGKVVHND